MSRIRSIKPEWLDDEPLVACSAKARVLSVALILLADDHGNGRASAVMLAGRVFPGEDHSQVELALTELVGIRYVHLYEVEGQRYYAIRNWSKHQVVSKPGAPKVPPPPDLTTRNHSQPQAPPGSPGESSESPGHSGNPQNVPAVPLSLTLPFPSPSPLTKPSPDPTEKPGSARARASGGGPAKVSEHVPVPLAVDWRPDDEQVAALAERYAVSGARILATLGEFRHYWRKGKGAGDRKTQRGWAQAFGNNVKREAKFGDLFVESPAERRGANGGSGGADTSDPVKSWKAAPLPAPVAPPPRQAAPPRATGAADEGEPVPAAASATEANVG